MSSAQILYEVTTAFRCLAYRFPTVKVVATTFWLKGVFMNPLQKKYVVWWHLVLLFLVICAPYKLTQTMLQFRGSSLRQTEKKPSNLSGIPSKWEAIGSSLSPSNVKYFNQLTYLSSVDLPDTLKRLFVKQWIENEHAYSKAASLSGVML